MVASLPPNIQLKLDQTLHQWRQWHCEPALPARPHPIARFSEGISNYSVLVEAGDRFVIRIDGAHVASNGLSRTTEWRALLNAYKAGLAPCPRYYNPELGALVCDYLPADNSRCQDLVETATLLRDIHSLPALHHRLDLRDRILNYERQLHHQQRELPAVMASCREDTLRFADNPGVENGAQVLCHNDLLAANRIFSGGALRAIDWEYCAMGSAWFDIAIVVAGDELNTIQTRELVNSYLLRPATGEEKQTLARCVLVYRYLELAWYLANRPHAQDLNPRLDRLQQHHLEYTGTNLESY